MAVLITALKLPTAEVSELTDYIATWSTEPDALTTFTARELPGAFVEKALMTVPAEA